MRIFTMFFGLLLVLPSFAFAVKIEKVDIDPGQPKAGDTVLITVKTDKNATKVEIDFPAVPGPAVKMQDKGGDKWQIKLKMSTAGEKKFKVTAYDKKGKKDSEEKKFVVDGGMAKSQPTPTPTAVDKEKLRLISGSISAKVDFFIQKWSGKAINFDKKEGDQCMDLMHQYISEVLGFDALHAATAYKAFENGDSRFTKITKSTVTTPQKGDIIFWKIKPYGHVAIFIEGNSNRFSSFDQNYPLNSKAHVQEHNYADVVGWLRPTL